MKKNGRIRQVQFVYTWALKIINKYGPIEHLTDEQYEDIIAEVDKYKQLSNKDPYCCKIMNDVLEAFDLESREDGR